MILISTDFLIFISYYYLWNNILYIHATKFPYLYTTTYFSKNVFMHMIDFLVICCNFNELPYNLLSFSLQEWETYTLPSKEDIQTIRVNNGLSYNYPIIDLLITLLKVIFSHVNKIKTFYEDKSFTKHQHIALSNYNRWNFQYFGWNFQILINHMYHENVILF